MAFTGRLRLQSALGDAVVTCAQLLMDGETEEAQPPRTNNLIQLRTHALRIARAKTGALLALSLAAPHLITASPPPDLLTALGNDLGIAFQYFDDLLDLYGDAQAAGKDLARDLSAQVPTLPLLDALALLPSRQAVPLVELLSRSALTAAQLAFIKRSSEPRIRTQLLARARNLWTALLPQLEEPSRCRLLGNLLAKLGDILQARLAVYQGGNNSATLTVTPRNGAVSPLRAS